jgi:hypothetical protein
MDIANLLNETTLLVVIAALVAVAFVITVAVASRRKAERRHRELRARFGPEYDVALSELGDVARADQELARRARRVEHFRFRDLSVADRQRFASAWQELQVKFIDDPPIAVSSANDLINQLMRARGYPTESFEQRVADLSVEHPRVVQHYRAAHVLSRSVHNGTVDTEQLRQAVIHYRALFAELLREGSDQAVPLHHAHAS